jgi:LmbE family N-acetylglucosaminyl deacetylase
MKKAFAIAAHPDDIEFMMSGTLLLLAKAGYEIHYMNVANGSCGTDRLSYEEIVRIRRNEAMAAARYAGAIYHESICDDIEVLYEREPLAKLCSIVREVNPEILLTHTYNEYMEDHTNTCRLAVSAAFCRGMKNFPGIPPMSPVSGSLTIYHALPYGLHDPLRRPVIPEFYVNVESEMERKAEMLSFHKSQKEWLDVSQGMDSYLHAMREMCQKIGTMSGTCSYAEGWTRHLAQGFGNPSDDPLRDALRDFVTR